MNADKRRCIGDLAAKVEARFNGVAGVFGLVSGSLVPLNSSGVDMHVAVAPPGVTAMDARLGVPVDAVAGDYSRTVILTFSNNV